MIFFVLVLGATAGVWLVLAWLGNPQLLVSIGLGLGVFQAAFGSFNGVPIGLTQVYPLDAVWLTAIAALGVQGSLRPRTRKPVPVWIVALLFLIMVSLVRGVLLNGPQASSSDAQSFLYLVGAVCGVLLVDERDVEEVIRRYVWAALGLAVLCVILWVQYGVGGSSSAIRTLSGNAVFAGGFRDGRPIPAGYATALPQAATILVLNRKAVFKNHKVAVACAVALTATTLLLQHRTVWFGWGASLLLAVVIAADVNLRRRVYGALLGIVVVGAVLVAGSAQVREMLSKSSTGVFSSSGTFAWRQQGWRELTDTLSALDWILGRPFGSGYVRRVTVGDLNGFTDVTPHNFYVQTVLRVGLVGAVVLFGALCRIVINLLRRRNAPEHTSIGVALLLLPMLCITYTPTPEQGLIVGVAIVLTKRSLKPSFLENVDDNNRDLRHHS